MSVNGENRWIKEGICNAGKANCDKVGESDVDNLQKVAAHDEKLHMESTKDALQNKWPRR